MKKIFSILLALGLLLGLSVIAAPASAQCGGTVTNCSVAPETPVECEETCYNITFNIQHGLASGEWIKIAFPSGAGLTKVTSVTTNGTAATSFTILGNELHVIVGRNYTPGARVLVRVCNVTNPVAGTGYPVTVQTVWDQCPCTASFSISKGGSVSPTTIQWGTGSGKNATTTITWGASTRVANVTICAPNYTQATWGIAADNKTLHIDYAWLETLGLAGCAQLCLEVDFDPGCNVTFTITVHECDNVTLVEGWNLISLPKIPKYKDITKVLADIDKDVEAVWYYDCGTWYVYKNGTGFRSLTEMDAGKAYWVDMKKAANLTVCGYEFPCPPAVPPKYCYHECWNMVGFKSQNDTMTLEDYTESVPAGVIIGVLSWNGTAWEVVESTDTMIVGRGYWMAFTDDACIVPPLA